MKILITGITGFIGSHIAHKCIEEGYVVSGIIRKNSNIKKYNLDCKQINYGIYDGTLQSLVSFMDIEKPDLIIHCAALFIAEHTTEQLEPLLECNIKFSAYIFEAMRKCSIKKIINTTTSWIHYHNDEYNPVCLYAATKQAVSDILKYYVEAEGFQAITMTIYDSYGDNDRRGKIFSLFDKIADLEQTLVMSGGEQQINFVHIADIECAFLKAIKFIFSMKEKEQVFQVRANEIYTLKKAAEIYEKTHNVKLPIQWEKSKYRKREVMEVYPYGNIVPGWQATIPLCKGLEKKSEVEKQQNL